MPQTPPLIPSDATRIIMVMTMSRDEVHQAEEDLRRVLSEAGEPVDPKKLRENARNGYSWAVVDMAFWRLMNRRELELNGKLVSLVESTV